MSNQMSKIQEVAAQFKNLEEVKKELKRIASVKCRLKKQKIRKDYDSKMTEIVQLEQIMKEVREFFEPKKTTVTTMTQEDVDLLTYDETVKAIKSIQSKKCNTQYLTENLEDNVEYQEACKIEEMLKAHRETVKPIEESVVKKSSLQDLLKHLEDSQDDLDKAYIMEQIKKLMN